MRATESRTAGATERDLVSKKQTKEEEEEA